MAKGGSKALTGVLCFIFGFLFAIIVEVAVIAAGVYFLLNANIDDIFGVAGIQNTDEDGNKIYINTNVDKGGVQKVTDLITALRDLSNKGTQGMTIGDLEDVFPVVSSGVDKFYSTLSGALAGYDISEEELRDIIDEEELKDTPLSQLGEFFSKCGDSVPMSTVLRFGGVEIESSPLYLSAAYGPEAAVIYGDGGDTVLYKDTFTLSGDVYVRAEDGAVLPSEYEEYLVERGNHVDYDLYYLVSSSARASEAYVVSSTEEGYAVTDTSYSIYSAENATLSGGYYYNSADELVVLHKRTLGELKESEDGIISAFNDVYITDVIGNEDDEILHSVLGGVTLGDLLNGKVSFEDKMDDVYVPTVIDVTPDDAIMMYVGYSLTDIQAVSDKGYAYTATRIIYEQDENGEWQEAGTVPCYVTVANGFVDRVYYIEDGKEVEYKGVSVSAIGTQTANITTALRVKDVIDIEEGDRLMEKLGEYKIADIGQAVDELYLSDFLEDISADDSLMAYMVYGISDIQPVGAGEDVPEGVTHTATYHISEDVSVRAYVVTTQQTTGDEVSYIIDRVYYVQDGEELECYTTINGVNDRVEGLKNDLKLDEIIEISEENKILYALKDSTINTLSSDIDSLSVQELFASDIYIDDSMKKVVAADPAEGEVAYSSVYLYYYLDEAAGEYMLADDGHFATLEEFEAAVETYGVIYSRGETAGTWSLLLYGNYAEEGQPEDKGESVYTVNNVAMMQENVLNNIKTSTLYELKNMGVISTEDSTLSHKLDGKAIGDMTIGEFLDAFGETLVTNP